MQPAWDCLPRSLPGTVREGRRSQQSLLATGQPWPQSAWGHTGLVSSFLHRGCYLDGDLCRSGGRAHSGGGQPIFPVASELEYRVTLRILAPDPRTWLERMIQFTVQRETQGQGGAGSLPNLHSFSRPELGWEQAPYNQGAELSP